MFVNHLRGFSPLHTIKSNWMRSASFVLVLLLVLGFLFRVQVGSSFVMLLGDRFDAIIEASILEHWFNFFKGYSSWHNVNYFSPYSATLGYNDGYFIYGVLFSFFRLLGFDIFLSSELVNVSLKTVGFISTFYLCRKFLGMAFLSSILAAAIFSLSNGMVPQARHAQLLSVCFSPLLTCLLFCYVENINKGKPVLAIFAGSAGVFLLNAWLITAFYMAWFFVFFSITFFLFFIFYLKIGKCQLLSFFLKIKEHSAVLFIPGLVWVVTILPFLYVYLPKASETGMHSFQDVINYAPTIPNAIDPGTGNVVFGALSDLVFANIFPGIDRGGELQVGFPPVTIFVCFFVFFVFWQKKYDEHKRRLYLAVVSAVFLSIFLVLKFGEFTFWKFIWQFFPGAKGMRVTARYLLFLAFPISVVCAFYFNSLYERKRYFLALLVGSALVLEQLNISTNAELNRDQQMAFLNKASPPPKLCRNFFVIGQRPVDYQNPVSGPIGDIYPHNVDAMLLAEHFKMRTVNGFSTFNPPFWDFRAFPTQTYMERVRAYVKRFNLERDLCGYDLLFSKWIVAPLHPNAAVNGPKLLQKESISIEFASSPVLSPDKKVWRVLVSIKNPSSIEINGYTQGLNLGIRRLDGRGDVIDRDYLRVPIGLLEPHGTDFLVVEIPVSSDKIAGIDIVTVQEGVAWIFPINTAPPRLVF